MDGGRRLLRPLKEILAEFQPSFAVYAGVSNDLLSETRRPRAPARPRPRAPVLTLLLTVAAARGTGLFLALAFLASVSLYGCILGGQYAAFTAAEGAPPDIFARAIGFGIKSVTIVGAGDLTEQKILNIGGIDPTKSLLFLDVAKVRERLKVLPLVKEVSVSKLYPHRLFIDIQERKPIALWQQDGQVKVIADDGMPIDKLDEPRFLSLPLAVGVGANAHIDEYLALLAAAGDLRPRIEAGIYVAQRRWTLKMKNGVEVALPETGAAAAIAELVRLQREYHVLDKDVVGLDLRIPGRLVATLPEAVARSRLDVLAHRAAHKGGQT
ncbi:Cell division protein FtsQ [Methylovirgula sp. HY1]|nr:Cell division protein FtsQ [Methylovirgula sp. HY1]